MKNEEAEQGVLLNLSNNDSPAPNQASQPIQPTEDHIPQYSKEFHEKYNSLLYVKDNTKKEIIINELEREGINYSPTQNSDYFQLKLIRSSLNFQAITVKCYMGPFSTILNIYRTNVRNQMHFHECLYGNSGNVYLYKLQGKFLALKCMQINLKQRSQITASKFVLRAIKQYFFAKIASALKVGPKLMRYQEFDLIFYGNCVQFWMEQCQLIEDERKRFYYKNKLTKKLRDLHEIYIVHCDIKVQNIAYSPAYKTPVFIDFGSTKVLNRGPGYKYNTFFLGTLDYCSVEMQNIYVSKSKGYVDLYFNDAHCLYKIFLGGETLSTCSPVQNILNDQKNSYDWYNAIKIQYLLYQNDLKKIQPLNEPQFYQNILTFLQQLMPNQELRRFYHLNWGTQWNESVRFTHLNHIYKYNKEYYFRIPLIPQQNGKKFEFEFDPQNWNYDIFKIFLQRTISFDQLDFYQQQQEEKPKKKKSVKMGQFLNKITIKRSQQVAQTYFSYKNNNKSQNQPQKTLKNYCFYLNDTLQKEMSQLNRQSERRIKDTLKRKALIEPYTHKQRFELIQYAKKTQNLDFFIYVLQCRLLESSFWDSFMLVSAEYIDESQNIADYRTKIKDTFKEVTQQNMKFYTTMISIFIFGESWQIQILNQMCQAKADLNKNKNMMYQLAKVKILLEKRCYIQAKRVLFANKAQFYQFRQLNFWHLFLFKLLHQEGSFQASQKVLKYIDSQLLKIGDQSLVYRFFAREREIYNLNAALYFQQKEVCFNFQQVRSLRKVSRFICNFIHILKKQEVSRWSNATFAEKEKNNQQSIREAIVFLQNLQLQKIKDSKEIFITKRNQVRFTNEIDSQQAVILQELKILQESYFYLNFSFYEISGNLQKSLQFLVKVLIKNEYLTLEHIDILDYVLKTLKLSKYKYLEQKLYQKIISQNSQMNFLKEKVKSFTFAFILNYAFKKKNFDLFKTLLLHFIQFVDANPTKNNINRYIFCLRYIFSSKFGRAQLAFVNSVLKNLNFESYLWRYSYSVLFRFEFILKLSKILDEKQLKTEIYRASKFIPYLNIDCVRWVQNILYPLVLKWDFKSEPRYKRLQKFILRRARKNLRFYAHITKKSYRISQILTESQLQKQDNQAQQNRCIDVLKCYTTNQLDSNSPFFHCKGSKKTKIGSFNANKRISKIFRAKLSLYHYICQNHTLQTVKQEQKHYLLRLAVQ